MKITKDNIITYGVVLFGSLLVAVGARIGAQSIGADDSTVSITFWSAIIICFIIYLLLQSAIEGCIGLLLKNKIPQTAEEQVQQVAEIEVKADTPHPQQPKVERPVLRVVEIIKEQEKPQPSTVDMERVRAEKEIKDDIVLAKKINAAHRYTKKVFAPYLSDEQMEKLLENIEEYASGEFSDDLYEVTPSGLATIDIYHFGWNIWNHFRCTEQIEVARFIKLTFAQLLKDVDDLDTIRKKLRYQDQSSTILLQKKI